MDQPPAVEPILVIDGGTVSVEDGALLVRRLGLATERIPLEGGAGPHIGVQRGNDGSVALVVAECHRTTVLLGCGFEEAQSFAAFVAAVNGVG